MPVAIVQFPGSNCDYDALHAFDTVLGVSARLVWHKETSLGDAEAIILPGGFSYGDYLRCGAIARFSPIMAVVKEYAANGGLVFGICNGFQILCEAGLLPGALVRNSGLQFRCQTQTIHVEESTEVFNRAGLGARLRVPIAHGEGNYRIDDAGLDDLVTHKQILFRYADQTGAVNAAGNPNGSVSNIAGIRNRVGNVFGMMPHPERVVESFHPSVDGIAILRAFLASRPVHEEVGLSIPMEN
ncbi:MAG TPA: phosphoribosylformylglycinamidine synthase subunit PurQ [Opitutales bacterium]|jgi:phosphoribosylformylglycinamidine synthase I|nr:phosphoribosylformylglycinamidine synthase subunit PurQ [Opitutales bacterium]